LLICAPKLNGLRYGAISASGKKGCDCRKKPAGVNATAELGHAVSTGGIFPRYPCPARRIMTSIELR
jgi:hypothetical protein